MFWNEARRERSRESVETEPEERPLQAVPADDASERPSLSAVVSPSGAQPIIPDASGSAKPRRLGDLLVERQLVSSGQLAEALLQQNASGKRVGSLLVELGALSERDLAQILSEQLGFPLTDLRHDDTEPDAVEKLPELAARSLGAIPIKIVDGCLRVAVADPSDPQLLKQLEQHCGMPVEIWIAPADDIRRAIDAAYRALSGIDAEVQAFQATQSLRRGGAPERAEVSQDAPVVRVANMLIQQALRDRASDIHIEPQDGRVRVRYRVDGALHDASSLPAAMGSALVSRIKVMAGMNIVERRRAQDGQITMEIEGRDLDIRVSTVATIWGEKAVLRLLDKSRPLFRLADVGLGDAAHARYGALIHSPFGMVIIAGPTGSGKTTTLYSTLMELDQSERNITTIEDPVEYVFPQINQIQINEQAGVTFAGGLKSILRQDPDVILVGEIRDAETARIAVQSALTGHFVLSSLHATDAASALQRFIDMGIESFLIASSVLAVCSQRLVRRVCAHCKVQYTPSAEELAFYYESGGAPKGAGSFWRGEGCNFCSDTGYHDRVGVFELLFMSDELKRLVVAGASHEELRRAAVAEGMVPMRQEALRLVADGVTTIAEVMRSIYIL